jgi:hypothetical protein
MALNNILSFSDLISESNEANKGLNGMSNQILDMPLFFDLSKIRRNGGDKKIISKIPNIEKTPDGDYYLRFEDMMNLMNSDEFKDIVEELHGPTTVDNGGKLSELDHITLHLKGDTVIPVSNKGPYLLVKISGQLNAGNSYPMGHKVDVHIQISPDGNDSKWNAVKNHGLDKLRQGIEEPKFLDPEEIIDFIAEVYAKNRIKNIVFESSRYERDVVLTSRQGRDILVKVMGGKITSIENNSGIRFPYSIGQHWNRSIETWACTNKFKIDGEDPCPEEKIFGIRKKDIPMGHELRMMYPSKFRK